MYYIYDVLRALNNFLNPHECGSRAYILLAGLGFICTKNCQNMYIYM